MPIDSIIFDLDGTLWDSREEIGYAWGEVLKGEPNIRKPITKSELTKTMGLPITEIMEKLFPKESLEVRERLRKKCFDLQNKYLWTNGAKLYDNLEDTINKLTMKYRLFIVSNCQRGYIEAFLNAHKMKKYFVDFECIGNTGLEKFENIKLVIKRNNLKNSVYVGDTIRDKEAADDAHIPFIYAEYGFGNLESDYKISSFEELMPLMSKLDKQKS